MKFFADTANIVEIEYCFSKKVNDGITTNPKIMEMTGNLTEGFEGASRLILNKFKETPISLETDLANLDARNLKKIDPEKVKTVLLSQAYSLSSLGKDVVVKIPICEGGILATKKLFEEGIKTNVTACMTPYQAIVAANAGATYVSLFANRMLDSRIIEISGNSLEEITKNPNWKDIVKKNKEKYFEKAWEKVLGDISYVSSYLEGGKTELIVGSIRTPEDIYRISKAEPQIITIPTKIVEKLEDINKIKGTKRTIKPSIFKDEGSLYHPMTQYTIEEFEESAKNYKK